jgi:hypothetical protein
MELPEDVRLKVYAIIRRLGDEGFVPNTQKFRRLDDNVYELKLMHPAIRLFCFRSGPDWVGTHGEKKPGKRDVRAHIAKVKALANRYRQEWI